MLLHYYKWSYVDFFIQMYMTWVLFARMQTFNNANQITYTIVAFSAKYSSYLADNEPDEYDELVRKSQAPARDANKGTHFIWMLIQSAKTLYSFGKFDIFQWIFQTNEMVDKYIQSEKWETWNTDQDKKWNCPPRIPTTTCQLTRNIVFYEKKWFRYH